jgi:ATP phosphoribosyltransferase
MDLMENENLIIGMPAGSLANASRGGNIIQLLKNAGFETRGYDSGGPTLFKSVNFLFGWDGRPQEFGSQLGIHELDVAIAGADWITERILELKMEYNTTLEIEEILPLNRGEVRIVGIAPEEAADNINYVFLNLCNSRDIITIVSEMPYLALNWAQKKLKELGKLDEFGQFSVQKYKTPSKIKKGIIIYETWGKTESKVKNGGADIGVEITQSGSALRNYGLKIIDEIMVSQTGIYINPGLKKDPKKKDLLKMFLLNLYGSVNAENKVIIFFNVPNEALPEMKEYLKENQLFADEPTINEGQTHAQLSIQVDTKQHHLPLAKIRYELAVRKAVNIDTIPIDSSIASINVLEF